MSNFKKVLVLAPHTDDEMGCAGSILKLIEQGAEVHYCAFSKCEESVPEGYPKDVLVHESLECTSRLGIPNSQYRIEDFPVRHFQRYRQEILEVLVAMRKLIKPELVFLPTSDDFHQDHQAIANEGLRAFKHSTILGYESIQNSQCFPASCFFRLDRSHIEKKAFALSAYKSQGHRTYFAEEFLLGLARVRGVQSNSDYAEAFEVKRFMI